MTCLMRGLIYIFVQLPLPFGGCYLHNTTLLFSLTFEMWDFEEVLRLTDSRTNHNVRS